MSSDSRRSVLAAYEALVIAARIGEPAGRAYFEKQVRPLLGPDDEMLAEQPLTAR